MRKLLKRNLWPCLSATAIATRFALAPMSVPFPPKSAPIASAYHKGLYEKAASELAMLGSCEMFFQLSPSLGHK